MRNTRLEVALYDGSCLLKFVPQPAAWRMVHDRGAKILKQHGKMLHSIVLVHPPPKPSESPNSPATITLSEMMANVGEPLHRDDFVSRARQREAHAKIEFFRTPSWSDVVREAPCPT